MNIRPVWTTVVSTRGRRTKNCRLGSGSSSWSVELQRRAGRSKLKTRALGKSHASETAHLLDDVQDGGAHVRDVAHQVTLAVHLRLPPMATGLLPSQEIVWCGAHDQKKIPAFMICRRVILVLSWLQHLLSAACYENVRDRLISSEGKSLAPPPLEHAHAP